MSTPVAGTAGAAGAAGAAAAAGEAAPARRARRWAPEEGGHRAGGRGEVVLQTLVLEAEGL